MKKNKLTLGWPANPTTSEYSWFSLQVYSWLPFDAHLDVLQVRARINLFYYYPSVALELVAYLRGSAHVHLQVGAFFHFDVSLFFPDWPWRRRRYRKVEEAAHV